MKIERIWSMPNKWTFTIKPIKELLEEEVIKGEWLSTRSKIADEISNSQSMFCICGKLASSIIKNGV